MSYLDPVVAEFVAKASEYIGPVEAMAKAADAAREANDKLVLSIVDLEAAMALLSDKHVDISASVKGISGPVAGAVAQIEALKAAMAGLDDKTVKITTDMNGTARAAAGWAFGFRLTGQALHWLVMGTLEVASTAIPALVAFGAAAVGLYPSFEGIFDRMNGLVTASGGLHGALLNSVGPLHQLGVSMGTVTQAMQPDAFIIFGSVINDLSGHMGVFAKVAEQAGNVLAGFATKITQDLSGPLGGQLAAFFQNAVKYMIQWGQVLGNLGHAFLNVVTDMFGVGQILLDVLVKLSQAFLALTSNPVIGFLIGLAAAMSAVYRYGQLMVTIFRWFGGTAIVSGIRLIATALLQLGGAAVGTGYELLGLQAVLGGVVDFLMGPAGIAIGVIAAALGVWYLASHQTADATTQLIRKVESMPPTVQNLTKGIGDLAANLVHLGKISSQIETVNPTLIMPNAGDIAKTTAALHKQAMELLNLKIGLAQSAAGTGAVAAGMNAISIQTGLADSKVQQLNQALDSFMQLVTGGTGGLAAFEQSLTNLTTGTNNVTTILGRAASVSLSVKTFAESLKSFSGAGAQAWQNFDQVLGSTMPQLMDWFRQAHVLGAAAGSAVTKAALDMASAMVPFAARSRTAQAELLAFVRAQGLNIHTFPGLISAIKAAGANQADLARKVEGTTQALSDLSQMAKNTSAILNQQMSTAIATAALKSSGFQTDISNAMAAVNSGVPVAGHTAQYWFNAAAQAGTQAGNSAVSAAQHVSSAATSMAGSAAKAGQAFANAKAQAQQLQAFIDSMHGKNISVTVSFPTGAGGYINSGPSGGVGGGGGTHGPNAGNAPAIIINRGTILSGQEIGRLVQKVQNQKTLRNASTQLFIAGRRH